MARNVVGIVVLISTALAIGEAAIVRPISDQHRSAAFEVFEPVGGSYSSLEETYEALKTLKTLKIGKKPNIREGTCTIVKGTLESSSSTLKDLYDALRVNGFLKCETNSDVYEAIKSRLVAEVKKASSLLDFHYSIGSLVLVKAQASNVEVALEDADGIFRSIKVLSQSDGRWRYSSNNPESSTYAAGLAIETLAGVVSLAYSDIDQSLISKLKNDIVKLFDSIEKYDDGSFYFDEKSVGSASYQDPLSTTSAVIRGVTAFSNVVSGGLNLPSNKILGLARYLLGIGVPGDAKDFFNQIDSLASLENNRESVPLILSLPSGVLSLTTADKLKVEVSTVLGSPAPPLIVKIVRGYSSSSKDVSVIENQELTFDPESGFHTLDILPKGVDVGSYVFVFEILLDEQAQAIYATGGRTKVQLYFTGAINVDGAEIAILDNDLSNTGAKHMLNLAEESVVSLSANHLQKLRLSFQLTTPRGNAFTPHQAFLILRHETKVEHIYVVNGSGKKFEILLDFLGLVEKLYYLSGKYDIELSVGDAAMENSFLKAIGSVELDLPEQPEKAARPPPQPVDPISRYGPKAEISHIFRAPDKRPPKKLSLIFLGLTFLPLLFFLIGLLRLGVNLKNFPTSAVPALFAILFHGGVAAVLILYALFWLKLDLFTTLKTLGFLGVFLLFVGHRILSHLASSSAKLKSA
uniref:Dolichyl-diphosphooligosaccharide--protein glycosyltransferase subunit 2 n=1 Tax=Kalanchoe fedtschenkoi TaxID=63787 RepID=A0A7N0UMP6_KALFE